jgi:hypothetical protein
MRNPTKLKYQITELYFQPEAVKCSANIYVTFSHCLLKPHELQIISKLGRNM